jgi:hypothetical protein
MTSLPESDTCIRETEYVSGKQTSQDHWKPEPLRGGDNLAGGFAEMQSGLLGGWADFPVRAQEGGGEAGSRRRKGTARTTVRGLYNFDRIRGQVARISTSARFMFIAMAMNCR